MAAKGESGNFRLQIPLDASGIKDFKPDRAVKVVAFGHYSDLDAASVGDFYKVLHAMAAEMVAIQQWDSAAKGPLQSPIQAGREVLARIRPAV